MDHEDPLQLIYSSSIKEKEKNTNLVSEINEAQPALVIDVTLSLFLQEIDPVVQTQDLLSSHLSGEHVLKAGGAEDFLSLVQREPHFVQFVP